MSILTLHPFGYCAHCTRPILKGQICTDINTPRGRKAVHAECLGGDDPTPPSGGTPAAQPIAA